MSHQVSYDRQSSHGVVFGAVNKEDEHLIIHGPELKNICSLRSIGQILLDRLAFHGEKIAHVNAANDAEDTYASLRKRAIWVAEALLERHVTKDDIITVCGMNSADVYATAIGIFLSGATVNFIDVIVAQEETIPLMLDIVRPKIIFSDDHVLDTLVKSMKKIDLDAEIVVYGPKIAQYASFSEFQVDKGTENTFKSPDVGNLFKTTAIVMFTSGSAGTPKGVMLSHDNLLKVISGITNTVDLTKFTLFTFSTLYWISAWYIFLVGMYAGAKRIYIKKYFEEELCLQIIQKHKPQVVSSTPPFMNRLLKYDGVDKFDMSSVLMWSCGGARVSEEQSEAFQEKCLSHGLLAVAYGMTELCSSVSCNNFTRYRFGSVGPITAGVSVKIIHTETGKVLGPNQEGEIYGKGATMLGYYNNPKATAEVLDEHGWIRTGDLGYYDTDNYLYVVDRLKEQLTCRGKTVRPGDIEAVINTHPVVTEASVVGVHHPVEGDILVAFVQLVPDKKVAEQEIIDFAHGKLEEHQQLLGGVIFLKQIPLLPSGKIAKLKLKTMANEMTEGILKHAGINI